MTRAIDLNADMGEYADPRSEKIEADLIPLITSCSIACGGHAGDAQTMRRTVHLAKTHNVGVGAHPAYPDREGFGRRSIDIDPHTLENTLREQIDVLRMIADEEHTPLRHVKAHGALYNDAAKNPALAQAIVKSASGIAIMGPPGSALESEARQAGCRFIAEGFLDRLYRIDGSLTPRTQAGAVIADIDARAAQGVAIASGASFPASDGDLTIAVQTLCIHSDSPGAADTACAVRDALTAANIAVAPFSIDEL